MKSTKKTNKLPLRIRSRSVSGLLFAMLLTAMTWGARADIQYEISHPVSVPGSGHEIQLSSGQEVSVIGTTGDETVIRVKLPDGSTSIAQVPAKYVSQRAAPSPSPVTAAVTSSSAPSSKKTSDPASVTSAPASSQPTASVAVAAPVATALSSTAKKQDESALGDQFKFKGDASALAAEVPLHKEWKLVWEDDFSKDKTIDTRKWNFEIDGKGGGNGEKQYYTDSPKNAKISNGELEITVLKNDDKHAYTSARMTTKGKYSVLYGRIEACIKSPKAQMGNWPAFWMMPEESKYGIWPRSGEIDIMEMINMSDTLYGTCHFGGPGDIHKGSKIVSPDGDFTRDYHVYAVEWEPKQIRWYLDGKFYGSLNDWHSQNGPFPAPFDQKFFIILNYAVGGAWPRGVAHKDVPDNTATFPQSMRVKYVRVYQP